MKSVFQIFVCILFTISLDAQMTGSFSESVTFNEPDYSFTRSLYYYVPADYDPAMSYKLVVGFRGGPHTNAGQFRDQLTFMADSIGAIILCPENDIHFNNNEGLVKQLFKYSLARVMNEYNIDEDFVYLTGLSYGGRHAVIVSMDTDNGPIPNLRGVIPFATGSNAQFEPDYSSIDEFPPACICIGLNDNANFQNVANELHADIQANGGFSLLNEIPNVGHTVAFATYPQEMMECLEFIENQSGTTSTGPQIGADVITITPNPASDYIDLSMNTPKTPLYILVLDRAGRLIQNIPFTGKRIALTQFSSGIKTFVFVFEEQRISKNVSIIRE